MSKQKKFDRFATYIQAVQSPETDVRFVNKVFKSIRGYPARTLREDFCGTFCLAMEWVRLRKENLAVAVDLDEETLSYGLENLLPKLSKEQQQRTQVLKCNVLEKSLPKTQIVLAFNFSYFLFKRREDLKKYFANVYAASAKDGIVIADAFGGMACGIENEERTRCRGFTYFWHQKSFDPVTSEAKFAIHFKPDGKKKMRDVFTYDWRLWSLPEIREVMEEVGFSQTHVYWEGSAKGSSKGNGVFRRVTRGEPCEAWIAYVVGVKSSS